MTSLTIPPAARGADASGDLQPSRTLLENASSGCQGGGSQGWALLDDALALRGLGMNHFHGGGQPADGDKPLTEGNAALAVDGIAVLGPIVRMVVFLGQWTRDGDEGGED